MIITILIILFISVASVCFGIFIGVIFIRPDPFQIRLDAEENQRNFDAGVLEGRKQEKQWQVIKKELKELKNNNNHGKQK